MLKKHLNGHISPCKSPCLQEKNVVCLFIIIVILAAYWQVQNFDYIYYDDHAYVIQNAQVMSGLSLKGIEWAFTTTYLGIWHPLTWLSLMFDSELYRGNPEDITGQILFSI